MNDYENGIITGRIGLGVDYYKGEKGDKPVKGVDYFTQEDIDEIAAYIESDGIDLSDYAKKEDVEAAIADIVFPAETDPVFTASAASAITSADISSWNSKSDFSGDYEDLTNKPTIPTKTSELTNDSNFVAQSELNDYATKSYVDDAIDDIPSTTYTLPVSTTSTLGGVKIDGSTITIDSNGVISATSSGGSSYTFTNGLTESNGTVSWDLNDRIAKGTGYNSVIEGDIEHNIASGLYSHAEGEATKASGIDAHAEGWLTDASGPYTHAEGKQTHATGSFSHAEGQSTVANDNSHAEGYSTYANKTSHAEGSYTMASSCASHAEGKCNIEDSNNIFQNIAGNGTAVNARSNSFARDWDGNEYLAGNLYVGCNDYSTTANGLITANAGGSKVATESYVDQAIADIPSSGGGSSYTAGVGIDIDSDNVISAPGVKAYPMFTSGLNGNVVASNIALGVYDEATLLDGLKNKQIMICEVSQGMSIAWSKLYDYGFSTLYAVNTNYQYDGVFPSPTMYSLSDSSTNNYNFGYRCAIIPIDNKLFVYKNFNSAKTYYMADLVQSLVWKNNYVNLSGFRLSSYLDSIDDALTNINTRIPTAPTADGSYKLTSTTTSGTSTYSWVADSSTSYTAGNGISIDSNGVISLDLSSAEGVGF